MNWFEKSFFNVHVDYHTRDDAATGAGLTREGLRTLLGEVRPDMIQIHSKGHPGIASYPTKVGTYSSNHQEDVMAIYRDVCREMGISFSVYYSSLVDIIAANAHEDWRIIKADGSYYGTGEKWEGDRMNSFFLCHNTGFIEDYLLPQIKEILVEYEPDGLWFDGDVWVSRVCYCASCQERYRELHGREVPRPADEEDWPLAPEFARETYLEYLQKVRDLIQEVRPECLFSVNWLHTLSNPWASRGKVDWLSGDVPLNHGVNAAGREARFMNHQGLPFDIMICDFSLDYRTRGYMYHKSAEQMKQEAAAAVANGARLFYWMTPNRDASFRVEDPPTAAEVGRFVRDRQPYCTATESVRDIAILVSAAGWAADPKIRHETEDTLRVFAAQQMLLESGLHHDLVSEDAFLKSDADWHTVILPGVDGLSDALLKGLERYVRNGGNLLLSLPLPGDRCAKLTGVERWAEKDIEDDPLAGIAHRVLLPSGWARVYYPAARAVEPHAEPRGQLWQAQGFEAIPQQPVAYVNRLGDGTVITCAGSVFDGYRRVQGPALRDLVIAELRFLHPHPIVELDPPGQLELSVRHREGEWLVHLVNHGADRDMGGESFFVERVPGSGPRTLLVRCEKRPESVSLQPGNRALEWQATANGVRCHLKDVGIHEIVQISFPQAV